MGARFDVGESQKQRGLQLSGCDSDEQWKNPHKLHLAPAIDQTRGARSEEAEIIVIGLRPRRLAPRVNRFGCAEKGSKEAKLVEGLPSAAMTK